MHAPIDPAATLCRVAPLFIECGERLFPDLAALFSGRVELGPQPVLRAWSPPAVEGVEIDAEEAAALALLSASTPRALPEAWPVARRQRILARLLELGLVSRAPSERRLAQWWPSAALYHFGSRWGGVTARDRLPEDAASAEIAFECSRRQLEQQTERLGPPPDHRVRLGNEDQSTDLPDTEPDPFDRLLAQRMTCRLFRRDRPLELACVARLLRRSFGVLGVAALGGGHHAVRKSSPSGGGLHPIEPFVLAVEVEGLDCGWYHYRGDQHRLAPIRHLDPAVARRQVTALTAGQSYFASAPLAVALALRFRRHHWKYPVHAKALRVMLMEAGHVGQTFQLAATHEGLGAFITCAINEVDLDRELGLDGVEFGCIALLGAGWPDPEGHALQLDRYATYPED
ncbi:MAG: hypothetical protein KatS3mg126_0442 [Lysobacteraceae bacterium]|nr:MAG: hypothetical protein KatS3mg126_0442 [Xanthomonadaceae bacterium]